MFYTNVKFISKLAKEKILKRKSWVKRNKKWMLPKVEKSYLKQEQDFAVPHKTIPLNENIKHSPIKNVISSDEFNKEGNFFQERNYDKILDELKKSEKKRLKPHEYKKMLKRDAKSTPPNDDKVNLKRLLMKGKENMNLGINDIKDEDKENKKKELNTFWYMPNPFEKKGVYGMKENTFYKSFIKDRERQFDKVDMKKLNENERKLLNKITNSNISNNKHNNISNELLDKNVSSEILEEKKEKKIRVNPNKYWFSENYSTPDISTINTVRARELRFLMMNEAKLVRKGKNVDVEIWLAFMNRVINLSTKVHVRSLLRYLQTIASVKVTNKKLINNLMCEIFKRENTMKPKHYVYLFQSCSRLKWNDFKLIYALKNMTLCWSILRNNFLIKSANSISKLGLANNVYSKALQITLEERLNNFTGKDLKAIKAITFLEFFNEEMIIKFVSLATFYKEHFNYYTRHLQILYLYIVLFHESIYYKLTDEQQYFLQQYSREGNLKKIKKLDHINRLKTLVKNENQKKAILNSDGEYSESDEFSENDDDWSESDEEWSESDEEYSDNDEHNEAPSLLEENDNNISTQHNEKLLNTENATNNISSYNLESKEKHIVKIGDKICGGYTSTLHKEISDVLNMLKIDHLNSIKCGPFIVDIYHPESNYIIELNAHFQYYINSEGLTTSSKWRHKFLSQMGYNIIYISHRIWSNLPTDKQKIDYISNTLPNIILKNSSLFIQN
ncbi:RAP protein, putative [Plasmodium vinckei lentum]|uniref:RAP protein, putative n=1 Tax=Plasmodium vinckei lentum TaxID=138297 RepID=A0A6V7S420_PLAVN|nr:RAP protein, putative [Plasmodium vinckei lentum]